MKRLSFISLLLIILLSSCNKDRITNYSNPHIEEFYFNEHKKITGIENIRFTIDTIACVIYNEDSASYNCDFSKVLPVPVSFESLSSISVNGEKWNYKDSLNMTKPITISTVGGNKKRTANYTVTLNKHKVEPDSIVWNKYILNEDNISSLNSCKHNNLVYIFFSNDHGCNIYTSTYDAKFIKVYTNNELNLNFQKSIIHNGKCYASSHDNKSLYYIDLNDLNKGFTSISIPENTEIKDIWGILDKKLFISFTSSSSHVYMSYDGNKWTEEQCNMLDELNTIGSAKINNDNTLYIISGNLNGKLTNNVLSTQNGNYWINTINQSDTLLYEPVKNACVVDYYDYFYLCGGTTKDNTIAPSYYSKNDGYSWLPLKSYQRPSEGFSSKEIMSACTLDDYIFILNCTSTSNLEIWIGRINKADFIIKK